MARLNLQDAEAIAAKNRPWTIRLEGTSDYWYATGRGLQEAVECGFGTIGNQPQVQLIDWTELRTTVMDKLIAGYQWAHTPYIRMSAASLTKLKLQTVPISPPAPSPAVAVAFQAAALFGQPQALRITRDGSKHTGFEVLDVAGTVLNLMSVVDGLKYAQDQGMEILFN